MNQARLGEIVSVHCPVTIVGFQFLKKMHCNVTEGWMKGEGKEEDMELCVNTHETNQTSETSHIRLDMVSFSQRLTFSLPLCLKFD
jgi:hypothetical protein